MPATVQDLIFVLDTFFPGHLPLVHALAVLFTLASLHQIFHLHRIQRNEPRQRRTTAWIAAAAKVLERSFQGNEDVHDQLEMEDPAAAYKMYAQELCNDWDQLYDLLGLNTEENALDAKILTPCPTLTSSRTVCAICGPTVALRSIRLRVRPQSVKILCSDYEWRKGILLVGHCRTCRSDYYPDRYTFMNAARKRTQRLEYAAQYLRISKHGIWVSRRIAEGQENSVREYRAGWSNFANWINTTTRGDIKVTYRQAQRLFIEHFSRRLLIFHEKEDVFVCPANLNSTTFAAYIRDAIGKDGGVLESSMHHGCMDCTHQKRYRSDLVNEGAVFEDLENGGMAGDQENVNGAEGAPLNPVDNVIDVPAGLPRLPPVQVEPPAGAPRGYVRMAVMDGKSIGHRICCIDDCTRPLKNFKTGRFCAEHLEFYRDLCGIIPCGRPRLNNNLTCDDPEHSAWYEAWCNRFQRMSYPNIRRVIRERRQHQQEQDGDGTGFRPILPSLGEVPGDQVVHTFRARTVYCIETVQWACGMPIGWAKCYRSESAPQVLAIINRLWEGFEDVRPGFISYDDACDLLRHIATQDQNDSWLKSTKFVVNAWHYTGHRATDLLCRLWCNPAPKNGSQPDLVIAKQDENGRTHQTRAFNTETAEQFNAWLNGYEAPLRNMTDVNFDLFMHVLFLIFAEKISSKVIKKGRELDEEFWHL